MTADEYIQLKAFARLDGVWLALLWTFCFASYLLGMENALMGWMAMLLLVWVPFFVAKRVRLFRDNARDGAISFLRGWGYVALMFFYASVLFAIVQYAYFAYIDQGYFVSMMQKAVNAPEMASQMAQYEGMKEMLDEALQEYAQTRPIDLAINFLTMNLMVGFLLGMPIAAVVRRSEAVNNVDKK